MILKLVAGFTFISFSLRLAHNRMQTTEKGLHGLGSGIVIHQAQLSLVFDCHPKQGRRAWPLQSSWVVLEQDTLTCCHPDWTALGWIIFCFFFQVC